MAEKNGTQFWRQVASHLIVILTTGLSAWFAFGGGIERSEAEKIATHAASDAVDSVPSRDDVSRMIATESPYMKDKSAIQVELKHIRETLSRIDTTLRNRN